nr:cytochrome P450 87A3-like [Ipomoea batatas]
MRLGNVAPGFFRRAIKDIPVKGYTIPSGWVIMIATAALHLNSHQFEDPLAFNPWRWQKIQQNSANKHFMPFGSGMKQCAGAEYSRVILATFLHVLVTNYKMEDGEGRENCPSPYHKIPRWISLQDLNEDLTTSDYFFFDINVHQYIYIFSMNYNIAVLKCDKLSQIIHENKCLAYIHSCVLLIICHNKI